MNTTKVFKGIRVRLFVIALVFIGVYALLCALHRADVKIDIDSLKEYILSFGVLAPLMYMLFFLLRPLVMFPAGVYVALSGVVFGHWPGFIYALIAAQICAVTEFFMARYLMRDVVSRMLKGKALKLDEAIKKHGFKTIFLLRAVPNVMYDIQNCSLGVSSVKFIDYFFGTVLGNSLLFLVFINIGTSLEGIIKSPCNMMQGFFILIILVVVLVIGNAVSSSAE